MLVWLFVVGIGFMKGGVSEQVEVACPSLSGDGFTDKPPLFLSKFVSGTTSSSNEFCDCSLTLHGTKRTAILKCDFNYEKDIYLKDTLFPFRAMNVSSAYVRMKNARSAIISEKFLSSWMDSPSSALDLWHCGKVTVETTPTLQPHQFYSQLKTFVGVGIINCSLDSLPSFFLRDRSRGAFRLQGCIVGKMSAGLFHNIEEIRYMNFEDTIVEEVTGPLSSSGVITLSKREIHSWDGIEFINSTFNRVAPFSFNVTHKDIMEKFIIKQTSFGKLEEGAITATGDIDVSINNCSFSELESMALQISVSGDIAFSNNIIVTHVPDSLLGLNCKEDSVLNNNIFYVDNIQDETYSTTRFSEQCGKPEVSYIVLSPQKRKSPSSSNLLVVTIVVLLSLSAAIGGVLWGGKNRYLLRYFYRRSDTPLWKEERTPDGEEDAHNQENTPATIVKSPVFSNTIS